MGQLGPLSCHHLQSHIPLHSAPHHLIFPLEGHPHLLVWHTFHGTLFNEPNVQLSMYVYKLSNKLLQFNEPSRHRTVFKLYVTMYSIN